MSDSRVDWRNFMLEIIDGKYSFDIQKIGDSSSFIKNQIESSIFVNVEYDTFERKLKQLIFDHPFTYTDIVNNTRKYSHLIEWGIRFCPDNKDFLKKIISLQFAFEADLSSLTEESNKEVNAILIRSNFGIVEFIEKWNTKNNMFNFENIYRDVKYLESIKRLWILQLSENRGRSDANIVKGLIYLRGWNDVPNDQRKHFFIKNRENTQLFSAILFDLKRLEKSEIINYLPFIADVKKYDGRLYNIIAQNSHWIRKESPKEVLPHATAALNIGNTSPNLSADTQQQLAVLAQQLKESTSILS